MVQPVRRAMMPEPLTIDATDSIADAARRMRSWGLPEALVVDDDRFVGRLSERDIVVTAITAGRHPATVTAGECCDRSMPAVEADEPAERAVELMRRHGLQRLPVLERGRFVGIVWATDVTTSIHPGRPQAGGAQRPHRIRSSR